MRFLKNLLEAITKRKPSDGSEPDLPWWQLAVGFVIWLIVEPARALWRRVYNRGLGGAFLVIAGAAASLFLVVLPLGSYLHSLQFQWWSRTLLSIVGGGVFFAYAFPALWKWGIEPTIEFCSAVVDRTRTTIRDYVGPFFGKILTALSTVTISGWLWKPILTAERIPVVVRAIDIVSKLSTLAGAAYAGWLTYHFVDATVIHYVTLAGLGYALGFVLALLAAVLVFAVLAGVIWQLIEYGKLPFLAEVTGALGVYAAFGHISALAVFLAGPSLLWTWGAAVLIWAVYVSYVFAGFIRLFSGNFWQKVFEKINKLCGKAYDEKSGTFRYFTHHVMTALFTALIGWATFTLCSASDFSLLITIPVVAVAVWGAYGMIFKSTDNDAGHILIALVLSVAGGYAAARFYALHGFIFGIWGATTAGIITLLALMCPVVPWIYLAFKGTFFAIGKIGLEAPVSAGFNRINAKYLKAQQRMHDVAKSVFETKDESGYREQFLHSGNIFIAASVWWMAHNALAFTHSGFIWALIIPVLATAVSYLFVGRVLLKSDWGVPTVATVLGVIAGAVTGSTVWGLGTTLDFEVAAFISFALTWAACVFVYFPPLYAGARTLTAKWTVSWLGPFLAWVYGMLWAPVDGLYRGLVAAVEWFSETFKPVFARIGKVYAAAKKAYAEFLKRIRGRDN